MSRTQSDLRRASPYHSKRVTARAMAYSVAMLVAVYLCTLYISPGPFTYALTLIPCGIIILSAIARMNDLTIDMASTVWNVRRNGLLLTALFAVLQLCMPIVEHSWPAWRTVIGCWGFAMVWLTTPGQPPWGKYISHGDYEHRNRRRGDPIP